MKPETSQSIQKVKLHILNKKHSAFIASMLYNLDIEPANVDKVMLYCTSDKSSVLLNEDWFNGFNTAEQASILVHEVMHYTLQHDLRIGRRDKDIYQKACDQVVNNLLLDMGYELPQEEKDFTRTKYNNMSVESVYKDIEQETKQKNPKQQNSSSFGNDIPESNSSIPDQTQQNKRNQQILSADMSNQAQGNQSVSKDGDIFSKLFKDIKEGVLDWKTVLAGYVDDISRSEMSYHQFNRRYLSMGLYLPDTKDVAKINKVALAFDVSGSVSEEETKAFLSEMRKIKSDINPEIMSVTTFNHKIVAQFDITEDNDLDEVTMDISGGTSLTPVFKYYNKTENHPNFLILFSDMWVNDFPEKTSYPVIWICINNPNFTAPFGKTIHITSEDLING